ncbi:MAG: S-layer homology domain-containing protein [Chloroflexota bacterium]
MNKPTHTCVEQHLEITTQPLSHHSRTIVVARLSAALALLMLLLLAWSITGSSSQASPEAANIGYEDYSFAPGPSSPTAEKPQSKLWFNDGIWWGSLFNGSTGRFEIYKLSSATQTWYSTGTPIDARDGSHADVLWDSASGHLYVATGVVDGTDPDLGVKILRYSYNTTTNLYTLDNGFPVTVATAGVVAVVLDKDSTGKLWITYTKLNGSSSRDVWVAHSTTGDSTWGAPFMPPLANHTDVGPDAISALVSFDGKIGLMWEHGPYSALYFAIHMDGAPDNQWIGPVTVIRKPDNHINLKSLQADEEGRVYAAVKSDFNQGPNPNLNDPLVWLFVLDRTTGSFQTYVVCKVRDEVTRPQVVINIGTRRVYVLYTTAIDGRHIYDPTAHVAIYYKQASLDSISFPDGQGTPFIESITSTKLNNVTTTKQTLPAAAGVLALAADGTTKLYFHNAIGYGAATPIPSPSTTAASPTPTHSTPQPTATPGACLLQFQDVPSGSTFYPYVRCLACQGIINGYPCGGPGEPCGATGDPYFRPGNFVTRGQLAKIIAQSAAFTEPVSGQTFQDVPIGSSFYTYTERLASRGVMSGYPCGTDPGEACIAPENRPYFRPNNPASRGQLTKIVSNAAGFSDPAPSSHTFADVPVGSTFHIFVERLLVNRPGVMSGYPCGGPSEPCDSQSRPYFRPGSPLTRGQTSKIVSSTFFPNCSP